MILSIIGQFGVFLTIYVVMIGDNGTSQRYYHSQSFVTFINSISDLYIYIYKFVQTGDTLVDAGEVT